MIDKTIRQIRKDFSDRMIFFYCWGKPSQGIVVHEIDFDIDEGAFHGKIQFPGKINKICYGEVKFE